MSFVLTEQKCRKFSMITNSQFQWRKKSVCSGGAKEVNSSGSISSESRNHGTVPKCNGNPQLKWAEKGRKWIIENINDWKTAC